MCQGVGVLAVWAVVEVLGCHSREVVNVSDSYVRGRKDVRALAGFHITIGVGQFISVICQACDWCKS